MNLTYSSSQFSGLFSKKEVIHFSKIICREQMFQNEIKFTELLVSFLVHLGIGRVVASQAGTADPHSPVSIVGMCHYLWLTEIKPPPLFAIYRLIKITQPTKKPHPNTNKPH